MPKLYQPVDNPFAVFSPINIVTKKNELVQFGRTNTIQQSVQHVQLAVNIAYGDQSGGWLMIHFSVVIRHKFVLIH